MLVQRNTSYSVNDVAYTRFGKKLKCITAGTTSTYPLILDGTSPITDGTVVWEVQEESGTGQGLVDYEANKNYSVGDIVLYNDKIYKCITAYTSTSTFDSTKWNEISGGGVDEWQAETDYHVDDLVIKDNKLYKCKTAHTSTTTFDATKFDLISGGGSGGSSMSVEYQLLDTPYTCTSSSVTLTLTDDPTNYDLIYICWHAVFSGSGSRDNSYVITKSQYDDVKASGGLFIHSNFATSNSNNYYRVLLYPVEGSFIVYSSGNGSNVNSVIIDNIIGIKYVTPYSDEEKQIGTWIDGSPLYQIAIEATSKNGQGSYKVADLTELSIDKVVSMKSIIYDSDIGYTFPYYYSSDLWTIIYYDPTDAGLHVSVKGSRLFNRPVYIILEYTKL